MLSKNINELIEEASKQSMLRNNIKIGSIVDVTLKVDQGSDRLVRGTVARILTSKGKHTRGIKVELLDGQVGRVQAIVK